MEAYKSTCPECDRAYRWIGYKTGFGKSPEQLERMERDHTVCKYCDSKKLNTELDDIGLIEAIEERAAVQKEADKASRKVFEDRGLLP